MWLILVLAVASVAVGAYNYIFTPVSIELSVDEYVIFADGQSESRIRIVMTNRLGWEVPMAERPMSFSVLEGEDLVEIEMNEARSEITVTAGRRMGTLQMIVEAEGLGMPQLVEIRIVEPVA